jgi:RimJ/RimL family protein N-acetyltransferase
LIGACDIFVSPSESREAHLGYILHPGFWGRGYMPEAARAVLKFGFEELGLHRIYAECHPRNTASARVMEKIGMRREGHFKENDWIKGQWQDSLVYAILEWEWKANEHA